MPRPSLLSSEDLTKLHAAGVTQLAIAEHYGLTSAESIRQRERRLGLLPRKNGGGPRPYPTVEDVLCQQPA